MNVLVCGRIKEGKSCLAIFLAHQHSPGVIVWDPRHMFKGVVLEADGDMSLADELEAAIEDKCYLEGPLVLWPNGAQLEEDFAEVCSVLFAPPERFAGNGEDNGGFAFVVDEAADLQKAQSINDALRVAVKQHPRTVNVIQCTHSLQEWNRASKDTMSDLYCFRLQGRSLTAAVEYADVEDEGLLRETIRELPAHAYVRVDFESQRGAPAWTVCKPLTPETVSAIQAGRIPDAEDNDSAEAERRTRAVDHRGRTRYRLETRSREAQAARGEAGTAG